MKKKDNKKINKKINKEVNKEVNKEINIKVSDNRKVSKFVYWAPRILSIIFLLFLAMFSLDVFDGNYGFWGTILALLMHNIPTFILLAILLISWKHELVGGVAFILAGLVYIVSLAMNPQFEWYMLSWSIIIAGPAFLIGILWLINWQKKK